jgi:hypothetical protein
MPARQITRNERFRTDAFYRWPEPLIFDVFEGSGEYVGQVRLPDGMISFVARGDTIWVVTIDADYVNVVTKYRMNFRE